jgi:NitT/TauT family transport system substrate-binding protein
MRRLTLLGCAAIALGVGCGSDPGDVGPIRVQLDWFPEPEHGALYQAEGLGLYAEAGLDVEIIPGGGSLNVIQQVVTQRVEIGQAASNQVILAVAQGLPVQIIACTFPEAPTVLMLHDANPVQSFAELDGQRLIARPGSVYLTYLRHLYGIDFEVTPQTFGLGRFLSDPVTIQEGFYIAEFYFIEKEGITPRALRLSEAGYRNSLVLIAHRDFLRDRADDARAFVAATRKGWRSYLEEDPTPGDAAIRAASESIAREIDDAFLTYVRNRIIADDLARTPGDGTSAPLGVMRPAWIEGQISQLEGLGLLEPGTITAGDVLHPLAVAESLR